jgi:hypothetical protein
MIIDQTRDDLNRLNQLVGEAETARRSSDGDQNLKQALCTSERALSRLLDGKQCSGRCPWRVARLSSIAAKSMRQLPTLGFTRLL